VEIRQQCVDAAELEPGCDEEIRPAGERRAAGERFEHAHGRCPDGEYALRVADPLPLRRLHHVTLTVDRMFGQRLGLDRAECVEADVERHPRHVQPG
jgi:hypothetical protein